jgi:DNA-directed RNA polymerase alpha subunit
MIKIPVEQIDFFRYRNMLFNLYSQFLQYREMIKENGGSDPEGWEMDKELDTAIRLEDWIVDYMPSVRAVNVLKSLGCYTLMDVVQLSEKTLKETPACGKKTLNEIKELLARYDLELGMDVSNYKSVKMIFPLPEESLTKK